jgi:hypothetical protein
MKFVYFIPAVAIALIITSCSPKKKQEPQPTEVQNIVSIKKPDESLLEITNDASGNPAIVKIYDTTLKINYEGNQVKTIDFKVDYRPEVVQYAINYINANEVTIEHTTPELPSKKWIKKAKMKFTASGLRETYTYESDAIMAPFTFNYRYDTSDNLIYSELIVEGKKAVPATIYENYDKMNNPFFARAKLWSIIDMMAGLTVGNFLSFPISRNNPQKISSENYYGSDKLTYTYDKNAYPTEITQYSYSTSLQIPAKDSDYKLVNGVTKLIYGK